MTLHPPQSRAPQTPLAPAHLPRFVTLRTVTALIMREMSTTYGRSPGGYIWAVLEPVLALIALVLIFSIGFRAPPVGTNFAMFYATGLLPFYAFLNTAVKVSQAVNFSQQLLAFPRVTFWDAVTSRFILSVLTQAITSCLIFAFILVLYDTRTILDLPVILQAFGMAAVLGLGVGLLNCVLITRYAIWHTVWSVLTRPLVLVSGVIFPPSSIPAPYSDWMEWNPVLHVVGQTRAGFYHTYDSAYVSPVYAFGWAVVCAVFGLLFLRRYVRDHLER